MGKIKTRDTMRDVKVFDRAKNLAQNTSRAVTKTKDAAEETGEPTQASSTEYATDTVTSHAKGAAHKAQGFVRRPVGRVRHARQNFRAAAQETRQAFGALKKAKAPAEKTRHKSAGAIKTASKNAVKAADKIIKTAKTAGKTVKTGAKTTKIVTKTATTTTKTTVMAARAAAIKVKVLAVKAKLIAKALIATVKLAIAAMQSLIALLIAGGWAVALIVVIIGVLGAFLSSPFGIFFSGEDSPDTGLTMQGVVSQLTTEFFAEIDEIAENNPHDELRRSGMTIRWNEVLAVYAVRVAGDAEHGTDVVTLDETRVDKIRAVLHDMVSLSYSLHTETREQTATDGDGNETAESVSSTVLVITLNHRTPDDMAAQYGFNTDQREMLDELLNSDNLELWALLLGGFMAGDGRVLVGNETFIPLGIFAWPMEGNWPITSRFGPRPSPGGIGSTNHQGIDIGAPIGTPILASADGVVTQVRNTDQGGWGLFVIIDHGGAGPSGASYQTIYAHNSRNLVSVGQTVVQGQVIAEIGSTGTSTGPHLHFEIRRGGTPVDPLLYFTW